VTPRLFIFGDTTTLPPLHYVRPVKETAVLPVCHITRRHVEKVRGKLQHVLQNTVLKNSLSLDITFKQNFPSIAVQSSCIVRMLYKDIYYLHHHHQYNYFNVINFSLIIISLMAKILKVPRHGADFVSEAHPRKSWTHFSAAVNRTCAQ